jgi:Family of unknown function (DUF5684)
MQNSSGDAVGALTMFGGLAGLLVMALAIYIILSIPLYIIAKKVNHDLAWLAFVPLANGWLMLDLAGLSGWLLILAFIPIVNIIFFVIVIYAWMKIAERMGHPSWLGLLLLVPLLGLIMPYYIAFADAGRMQI